MEDDSTATESELSTFYPKTCLICFGTDKSSIKLFELWIVDSDEITLLDKLESLSKEKLVRAFNYYAGLGYSTW